MSPVWATLTAGALPLLLVVAAAAWTLPGRPVGRTVRAAGMCARGGRSALEGEGLDPDRDGDHTRGTGRTRGIARSGGAGRAQGWRQRLAHRRRRPPPVDLGAVLTEVAARISAGAAPGRAWQLALPGRVTMGRAGMADDGVPAALGALRPVPAHPGRPIVFGRRRAGKDHVALIHQIAGAEVACRMAHTVGAPLARVLQASADGVVEAGRARAARRTALAAPRATARLLGWLPLAGLVLGSAWGASPAQVLFDGGWGSACLVLGVLLMAAGHLWSARLVRAAERVGS
ncbi:MULTISPECIES: hypothetical protein [unclassified Pseudactinotalea]|uniref:hypothetical protein n=1 Tax=Micrococcales TaxID=85006 RepID=UPI003C7DD322